MNIKAKQITEIATSRFDITTVLGFFYQMKDKIAREATLTAAMGAVWTSYTTALQAFDDAYAQVKKWMQTADLEDLDKQRDDALSAFLQALKAMTQSPNALKAAGAKTLMFIREKYKLDSGDEYMKETTAISQMIQEMESDAMAQAALQTTGLDDWLHDLKIKNDAFLVKMNERTEAQAGLQKGIVREKRLACEAAYRDLLKLINAMAICEVPAGYNFVTIIDLLNAEVEHYRQILARKGYSTGGGSQGGGSSDEGSGGSDEGGGGSDEGGGGSDEGGGGSDDGGDTPTPTPTPDPSGGGDGGEGGNPED